MMAKSTSSKKKDKKSKEKKLEKAPIQVLSQPGEAIRSSFMEVKAAGDTVVAEPRPPLSGKEFEKALEPLQVELVKLQE
jgi:hypothetical protein